MENTEVHNYANTRNLEVREQSIKHIKEAASWGRFLAVLGFIGVGIVIAFSIFMVFATSSFMPPHYDGPTWIMPLISGLYILIGLIYLIPFWYLYRFSKSGLDATRQGDSQKLADAFRNLKSMFKFLGIFILVFFGLYATLMISAVFLGGFGSFI